MPAGGLDHQRHHYAGQDYLTRFSEGAHYLLRIDSVGGKPGWEPRIPGDQMRPDHPGSAIHFEDEFWEVVARSETTGTHQTRTIYHLNRWDDRFPLRVTFNYDRDAAELHALEQGDRVVTTRRRRWLTLLAPVVGMLPSADQLRIEERYGIDARQATMISAGSMILASWVAVYETLRAGAPAWLVVALAAAILSAESALRLRATGPRGLALVVGPIVVARTALAAFSSSDGAARAARADQLPFDASLLTASDTVDRLDDGRIEVVSALAKPHWSGKVAIRYEGILYRLESEAPTAVAGQPRRRFVLHPDPTDSLITGLVEYVPTEVRDLYVAGKRERYESWIETAFAAWGLLPTTTQQRLARVYLNNPKAATGWSIVLTAIAGVVAAGSALYHLSGANPEGFDRFMLVIGVALGVDAGRRTLALWAGRPVGSPLGLLLRPFAARMLR